MLKSWLINVRGSAAQSVAGHVGGGVKYVTVGKQRQGRRDEEGNKRWGVLLEEDEWDEGNERLVSH